MPPGDAGLTRRVKAAGPSWTVIEKRGRKTVFLEATLRNEAGELVAKSSSTAKLVPVKR